MLLLLIHTPLRSVILALLISLLLVSPALAAETYKYKDKENNWVFSDKKPPGNVEHEEVEVKTFEVALPNPTFKIQKAGQKNVLKVKNPIHAPMEVKVWWPDNRHATIKAVVPANR